MTDEQQREVDAAIRKAAKHDLTLTPEQFQVIDGEVYLDGMDPSEWINAMTMD